MKSGHWNDKTFAAWALDPTREGANHHLEVCSQCRSEAEEFRRAAAAFSDGLHRAAQVRSLERGRQAGVEAERSVPDPGQWHLLPRLIPVLTLALILLAVAIAPRAPRPVSQPAANAAADNALLIDIQRDLNRQAPEALAPAQMLFAEASTRESSGGTTTLNEGTQQ